ncbi:hypothetical protein RHSIM_Rhsim01G0155800 [Rhododendron simsii]|uniref:HAT C-terminal dimerisation domain-containing protein n=1 Tax=Rhododendron simsii TaxID=118357 RepID=A0A834HJP0_RHOSS|nr:hypothetical protein RHSIM_Rhsim01G0155800 [Rhododendron simsii]
MRFVSETQRLRSFPVTDVYGEFPFPVTDVNRSGPSLSRRQQEMDPENIHFDNEGLNPDLDDDEPTLPTGRESVGEAASNTVAGFTPTCVTGCSQSAQSGGTRRYSWYMCTDGGLTRADWKIAFEFMNFLKIFYAATLACSGVRYPTTCIVLNHLYNMSYTLKSHRTKPIFVAACKSMEDKFNKYFENMPTIFIVTSVMDPRIKIKGVEKLLKVLSENLGITLPSISTVTALLTSIYASYESKFACTAAAAPAPYSSSINDPCSTSNNENDPSWFLISGPGSSETSSRSELTQYLEINLVTNEEFQSFDILAWWKKTEKTFPILSIMARDLLTPLVSSVASESAFSAGNRVLDERRSRLAPDILDCLICLKDWEDARLGIQKCHPRDEFRDYFSDSDIDAD